MDMSYSVESINSDGNSSKTKQAQQEQILQMQQLKESKRQDNGTKVEDPAAITAAESKTDKIEISAEGQKALKQIKAAKAGGQPAASAAVTESTEKSKDEISSVVETTDSGTSSVIKQLTAEGSDDVSSSDLYTMSESELSTLVAKGTITRKEMEQELERRSPTE